MLTKNKDNINIVSRKYDLFLDAKTTLKDSDKSVLILNVCNNMNTFGAGFNKDIAKQFPLVKENYHLIGPSKLKNLLGYTQFIKAETNPTYKNNIVVANLICQSGIISSTNPRPLNYSYFSNCLVKVNQYITEYNKANETKIQVYSPKFNAGVLGANWLFLKELMIDTIKKPTYIQVYESYS